MSVYGWTIAQQAIIAAMPSPFVASSPADVLPGPVVVQDEGDGKRKQIVLINNEINLREV